MTQHQAVDVGESFSTAVENVIRITPKILLFLLILVAGWIIASALGKALDKVLDRVGFNKAAERSGIRRWTGQYQASALLAKLVFYALMLFVLQLAFGVFGPNAVSDLIKGVVAWLPKAFVAIVILVVAAAIAAAVRDIINAALSHFTFGRLLGRIAQIAIVALGVIAALNQIGVATTVTQPLLIATLATIGGILIVGVGGGLVMPMKERWERLLNHAERQVSEGRQNMQQSGGSGQFTQPSYTSSQYSTDEPAAPQTMPPSGHQPMTPTDPAGRQS